MSLVDGLDSLTLACSIWTHTDTVALILPHHELFLYGLVVYDLVVICAALFCVLICVIEPRA